MKKLSILFFIVIVSLTNGGLMNAQTATSTSTESGKSWITQTDGAKIHLDYVNTGNDPNIILDCGSGTAMGYGGSITLHASDGAGADGGNITLSAGANTTNSPFGDDGVITLNTDDGSMTLKEGKLGIGTTNPQEKLQVEGLVKINTASGYMDIGSKNSSFAHFYTDLPKYYFNKEIRVNSGYIGSHDEDLSLRVAGSTKMTITSSGSVAVDVGTDKNFFISGWELAGSGGISIGTNNDANSAHKPLAFVGSKFLFHSGNVGIGTTNTDGYKLAVNGGILCESIKVITNVPSSDYVFEEDYNLKSLDEVEEFIKENKHLPEVPSAQEFKDNGYMIGDMDDLLLRKVEELTLYLIEMKKENEELKSRIQVLEE